MSSITDYKTKTGKHLWRVSVYAGRDKKTGKKIHLSQKGITNKTAAKLVAAKFEIQVAEGNKPAPKVEKKTFGSVFEEWYNGYQTQVRESTLAVTRRFSDNHLLPAFGEIYVSEIEADDLQKVVNKWANESSKAYKRWFQCMRRVLLFAVERGYLHEDPARFVKVPKFEADTTSDEDKFWTKEEVDTFLRCIDPAVSLEKYAMFRLYALSGLRRGELLALRFSDLDFDECTISVVRTVSAGFKGRTMIAPPKTFSSRRVVPIDQGTMKWLKRWQVALYQQQMQKGMQVKFDEGYVFPNAKGGLKSLNTPRAWLLQIIKDNHLKPIKLHQLRHSYISNLLISGAPISAVSKLVGHSDSKITQEIYSHVNIDVKKEAADGLAKYLGI